MTPQRLLVNTMTLPKFKSSRFQRKSTPKEKVRPLDMLNPLLLVCMYVYDAAGLTHSL